MPKRNSEGTGQIQKRGRNALEPNKIVIGKQLRKLREAKGYTQEYLAALSANSQEFVSNMERGNWHGLTNSLYRLCDALDTPFWKVLEDAGL